MAYGSGDVTGPGPRWLGGRPPVALLTSAGRARLRPGLSGACGPASWLSGRGSAGCPGRSLPRAVRRAGLGAVSPELRNGDAGNRGGDVLHHILDPRSGLPAAPVWRTVSVAAATAADANAASTAAIIRGEAALAWLTGLGLPARLVAESGAVVTLGGWPPEHPSAA